MLPLLKKESYVPNVSIKKLKRKIDYVDLNESKKVQASEEKVRTLIACVTCKNSIMVNVGVVKGMF